MFDPPRTSRAPAPPIGSPGLAQRPPPARLPPSRGRRTRPLSRTASRTASPRSIGLSRHARSKRRGPLRRRSDSPCERIAAAKAARVAAERDPNPRRRRRCGQAGHRAGRRRHRLHRQAPGASRWSREAMGVRVLSRSIAGAQFELSGLPVEVVEGALDDPAGVGRALDGHRGRLPPGQGDGPALAGLRRQRPGADPCAGRSGAGRRRDALHLHRHDRFLRLRRRQRA